jgi:DNA-binding XRE family transcriptional regulator
MITLVDLSEGTMGTWEREREFERGKNIETLGLCMKIT